MDNTPKQSGAVSLFAVIFATLLLSILMVGFMKLMLREQQQATNSDLSQSAYDAALVGVEDVKRVIRACQGGEGPDAAKACAALEGPSDCQIIARAGITGVVGSNETVVQSRIDSQDTFNQAYTCVNVTMDTDDFRGNSTEGSTALIPLQTKRQFNKLVVDWYTKNDTGHTTAAAPPIPSGLPAKDRWGARTPPLLRLQLIAAGDSFKLDDLDTSTTSKTVFVRPSSMIVGNSAPVNPAITLNQSRATDGNQHDSAPISIACSSGFRYDDTYACRATFQLDGAVSASASRNAFLRLNMIYKSAEYRVSLYDGDSLVQFHGVQPAVDSTGRASNLFRRVEARLRVGEDFPFPDNAIELTNSLCKDFSVVDGRATAGACRP